jgi:hypothetical protein
MKTLKNIILVLLPFFLLSCGGAEKAMQHSLDKLYIGMTIPEFKSQVIKSSMVYLSEDYSCFKLEESKAKFGEPGGYVSSTRFIYFKDGKLWKIDEGERSVDYRIRVD